MSRYRILTQANLISQLQDLLDLIISPHEPKDASLLGIYLSDHAPDPSPLGVPLSKELSLLSRQLLKLADPSMQQAQTIEHLIHRKKELEKSKAKLHNERLKLANATCTILETQQEVFTTSIGVLESVKYGSVARASNAEASYFVAAAEGLDEKLRYVRYHSTEIVRYPR